MAPLFDFFREFGWLILMQLLSMLAVCIHHAVNGDEIRRRDIEDMEKMAQRASEEET